MENKVVRPISIWIAQVLLMLWAFQTIYCFLVYMLIAFGLLPFLTALLLVITELAIVALLVIAFWALARRKSYGRWLGIGILSLKLVFLVSDQFFSTRIEVYPNGIMTGVIPILLFISSFVVIVYLSLSKKVDGYLR